MTRQLFISCTTNLPWAGIEFLCGNLLARVATRTTLSPDRQTRWTTRGSAPERGVLEHPVHDTSCVACAGSPGGVRNELAQRFVTAGFTSTQTVMSAAHRERSRRRTSTWPALDFVHARRIALPARAGVCVRGASTSERRFFVAPSAAPGAAAGTTTRIDLAMDAGLRPNGGTGVTTIAR